VFAAQQANQKKLSIGLDNRNVPLRFLGF